MLPDLKLGTCSWNFDSWVGLVYTRTQRRAADYLPEYAARFNTAEIDSWFYRMPDRYTVNQYLAAVPEQFTFTCKVPQEITRTHHRQARPVDTLEKNPTFLSVERFLTFLEVIEPALPQTGAIMFEFEYLNKQKIAGMVASMLGALFTIVSVNNHYEGSAPITAADLRELIGAQGTP